MGWEVGVGLGAMFLGLGFGMAACIYGWPKITVNHTRNIGMNSGSTNHR
jgi:hypothetical protein